MEVGVLFIEGKRHVWLVKEARSDLWQLSMLMGSVKMQGIKLATSKVGGRVAMVSNLSKIAHAAACRQVSRSSRGSREPRPPPRLPLLSLRGLRPKSGIPRGIPRTHCTSRNYVSPRPSPGILNSARIPRRLNWAPLCPLFTDCGAEFRQPRELREDSNWPGVWLGLRVGSGWFQLLISTARLSLTRSKHQIRNTGKFLK